MSIAEKKWREYYFRIHSNEVAEPMTKEQILFAAQGKGVQVNEQNFDQIFRFVIEYINTNYLEYSNSHQTR